MASWSYNSRYLATKHGNKMFFEGLYFVIESFPNIIWIWDIHTLKLTTLLIQLAAVKSMAWSPKSEFLFFSTGNSRLLIWSP